MKSLPITLAILHAVLAIGVFSAAILSPERNGLAPVLLVFVDFPVSLVFEWGRKSLHGDLGFTMRLVADCIVYTVGGSLWFYGLGVGIRQLVRAFRR